MPYVQKAKTTGFADFVFPSRALSGLVTQIVLGGFSSCQPNRRKTRWASS